MRTRLVRVVVALSSLLGAIGVFAPQPASATSVGTIAFVGTASTPGGLWVPCVTNTTTGGNHNIWTGVTKTKTTVTTPVCRPGTSGWAFGSTICVGVKANVNKPGKPPVTGPDVACSITASGTLTGYCLASSGQGTGVAIILGHTIRFTVGWTTSVGGFIPLTGHAWKTSPTDGRITGFVNARPAPGTGNCVTGPATTFDIQGSAGAVDPTVP